MFKFFRFKSKDEFDASVGDMFNKLSSKIIAKFDSRVNQLVSQEVFFEISRYEVFFKNQTEKNIKNINDNQSKIIKLNEEIKELKVKLKTILNLLRVNK